MDRDADKDPFDPMSFPEPSHLGDEQEVVKAQSGPAFLCFVPLSLKSFLCISFQQFADKLSLRIKAYGFVQRGTEFGG